VSKLEYNSSIIPGLIQDLGIYQIKSCNVCRAATNEFDNDLENLCQSIRQKGLLQPIVVRAKERYFEVVAGNRRYNACKILGWRKIACHILELDDREAFEVSLAENIQRQTLTPLEEANAFKKYVSDFGWGGVTNLALKINKSPSYVTKRINLLDLSPDVLNCVNNSKTPVSIAEELHKITDKSEQTELGLIISSRHLSFRKARKLIKNNCGGIQENKPYNSFSYRDKVIEDDVEKTNRSFDKSIVALRVAMNRIGEVIQGIASDNWVMCEILMQHKNMLHSQIDLLIKEKRKF
jgi:ParB family transcriptional regulator, chromosome partitioning protein